MSVTLHTPLPHHELAAAPTARLALRPVGTSRGLLAGAWWPRSRDLATELPALTDVLDPLWGRITRVAVYPKHWRVLPRTVAVDGRVVKVGWFTPEIAPHRLRLFSAGTGRRDLLVVPPGTGPESAARLMAAASDHAGPPLTASALIAAGEARRVVRATAEPLDPDEAWEYEGGAAAGSTAGPERTVPEQTVPEQTVPERAGRGVRPITGR